MIIELSRADRSRLHVAMMDALEISREEPQTPNGAARAALAEAVAMHCNNPAVSLDDVLNAADAVCEEIERRTGGVKTPIAFDIPSLMHATGFKIGAAELVARL